MTPIAADHLRLTSLGLAAAAVATVGIGFGGPLRAAAVLAFLLAGPGLAVAPLLGIEHGVGQLAAAVGLSLAALIAVSEALVYAQVSSAGWALAVLASATVAFALPPLARRPR